MSIINEIESLFHPLSLEDKEWTKQAAKNTKLLICDQLFPRILIGQDTYGTKIGNVLGCIVYKYKMDGEAFFSYPIGERSSEAFKLLCDYIRESGKNIRFYPTTEYGKSEVEALGGGFSITPMEDNFDYVYLAENLRTLAGKKYSGKRNHINRFTEAGDWLYEPLSKENAAECMELLGTWASNKVEAAAESGEPPAESLPSSTITEYQHEAVEIQTALDNLDTLGFFGGVIRKAGRIVAFSICEELNSETMVVHYEKADASIQGTFQIINRETIAHADEKYVYVNREDDLGIPGLRKAKLSYYPDHMEQKYMISLN